MRLTRWIQVGQLCQIGILVVPVMVSILLNTNPPTQGTGSLVCILKPTLLGLIVKAAYILPWLHCLAFRSGSQLECPGKHPDPRTEWGFPLPDLSGKSPAPLSTLQYSFLQASSPLLGFVLEARITCLCGAYQDFTHSWSSVKFDEWMHVSSWSLNESSVGGKWSELPRNVYEMISSPFMVGLPDLANRIIGIQLNLISHK